MAVVAEVLGYAGNGARSVSLATGAWIVVGALVVVLRPGNTIGWLFSAVGLLWLSGLTLSEYARTASGAVQQLVSWYAEWFWIAGLVTMICDPVPVPDRPRAVAGLALGAPRVSRRSAP